MGAFDDLLPQAGAFDDLVPAAAAKPSQAKLEASSPIMDVGKSLASGVGRGLVETIMLPATVKRLAEDGTGWAVDRGDELVRHVFGLPPVSDETKALRDRASRENLGTQASDLVNRGQDATRAGMDEHLHKPETVAGEYARTIGEFAPGAVIGPGRIAAKAVGDVLIPAIFSETAGQATKGSNAEGVARFVGALGGNLATATARARASAPERVVAGALEGVTPAQMDEAAALQTRGAAFGVPLSGPEAVQAATSGGTKLGDVQRVVEGSTSGGARTAAFYADRPQQVRDAVGRTLDEIAPADPRPSTLGPRAAEAAQAEIDDVRTAINAATRPAYRQAEAHLIAPDDFEPIARDPAFQASLRRLRSDEVLAPRYADQPDNAIAVVDAVTKDMRDRGVALSTATNPGFSSQTAAAYGGGAAEARDIARNPARGGSQAYDDALVMQEQARRQNLEPLEHGPLGQLAEAGDTAAATRAVLPPRPLAGGDAELVDTIMRLAGRDGDLASGLVRQRLADQFDHSAGRLVGGENQYGGARFAKDIAGTPQMEANLQGVVGALPSAGAAAPAVDDMVEILRATGMRKPQGSATEFNRQISDDIGVVPLALGGASTLGTAIPRLATDAVRRAWYGRGASRLADMFVSPDSVEQMRAIAARGAGSPFRDAILRQGLQGPNAAN